MYVTLDLISGVLCNMVAIYIKKNIVRLYAFCAFSYADMAK